jgi:oxalyl-CoA decarboxylase
VRDIVKANPEAILVNEGANALDFTRSIVDMYQPRKRLDVGTWGVMGIGMGFAVAAAVESGERVVAVPATAPSASPAWRSRPCAVTTCRCAS